MASLPDIEQLDNACQIFFKEQLTRLETSLETLPDKPEETPFSTLCTLWQFSLNNHLSCSASIETPLHNLPTESFDSLRDLVEKRIKGTPLAHIVGRQSFMGLELLSDPSALIPRKETEQLANVCLNYISTIFKSKDNVKIIDLFTGCGNLPLCFANKFSQATVYGADISSEAIVLARKNSKQLNLPVQFEIGDMFGTFESDSFYNSLDLISGAPPYIIEKNVANMADEISNHEPKLAFEAGPFGFTLMMRMINESHMFLRKGGWLVFEVGAGQGKGISGRLKKNKYYDKVKVFNNNEGTIRVVAARRA